MRQDLVLGLLAGAMLVGAAWFVFQRSSESAKAEGIGVAEATPAAPVTDRAELVRSAALRSYAEASRPAPTASTPYVEPAPAAAPPLLDATAERDQHVTRLVQSGPAPGEYLTRMREVEQQFVAVAKSAKADVDFSSFRCYRAGCYVNATFKQPGLVEGMSPRFTETPGFRDWPGGKFRSGLIEGRGGTEVTWIFFGAEDPTTAPAPDEP